VMRDRVVPLVDLRTLLGRTAARRRRPRVAR